MICMKSRRIIWVWTALIFIAGSLFLPAFCVTAGASQKKEDTGIDREISSDSGFEAVSAPVYMDVAFGYDGAAKGGRYVPVRISLGNEAVEAFKGTIKILSMESDYDVYKYDYSVSLEGEENKEVVVNIPLGSRADQLYVSLLDQRGNELIKKRLKMDVSMEVAELFVGILSDTPEQLQYLNGIGVSYSTLRTRTFSLTENTLPEEDAGLDLLDVLLITNYDTKRLSQKQIEAMMEWVHKGGVLLLGTGERVSDTLDVFSQGLLDEPYAGAVMTKVDMGVEFAVNNPGDYFIEIPCVNLSLRDGTEILSNDELSVLTAVYKEKGLIAVAAYDFIDIAQFCQTQRSYVDKLFTNLLGEDRINELASSLYNGNSSSYWMVQSMINAGNVDKLPNLALYTAVVLVYIALVGPGLYLFLKRQERRRFYRFGIVVLSLGFAGIIYIMGNGTRFKDTFFTYATIEDVSEDHIVESTYVNVRTPYNKPYSIALDPSYDLYPITRNATYDMSPLPKFTGNESYKVNISRDEDQTQINLQNVVAFTSKFFSLQKRTENVDRVGFSGDITVFDGEIYGTVTNQFDFPVEHAAVLLYGQMILLDDLEPGETRRLDGLPVLNYPVSNIVMVAERISGGYRYSEADIHDKEYMKTLARTNILNFYLGNNTASFTPDARIVAFSPKKTETKFLLKDRYETYGITMLTSSLPVNTDKGDLTCRSALMKRPTVVSGQYYASSNAFYGVDPVVLEYSLGNDINVEKLTFKQISKEFLESDKYGTVTPFKGGIYFYNHDTGIYDQMEEGREEFMGEELKPYLSPGNTITVKYVSDNATDFNWYVVLPMPEITGKEK